jgi:hypothetical protein
MECLRERSYEPLQKEVIFAIKEAKNFFEEITGINLKEEPIVKISPRAKNGPLGRTYNNIIEIASDLLPEEGKIVILHEFIHWSVGKTGKREIFDRPPYSYPLAFPLWLTLTKKFDDGMQLSFIEEGIADFFAAVLASKDKSEIPRNTFFFYSDEMRKLRTAVKEVYFTLSRINGNYEKDKLEEDREMISDLIKELSSMFSFSEKTATVYVGRIILLLGNEIYKRNYNGAAQLLEDMLSSPYSVVDKIILEIKNDKERELLKGLLSKFSSEFAQHMRDR